MARGSAMELADPLALGFDPARLARIDCFLAETYIDTGKLPCAQILVARDGQPVHFGQLGTLRADGTPIRADALFRIASMTKPVTSVAFMQLVEQAKVALDDPVARVLPELANLGVYAGGGGAVPFAPAIPTRPIRFVDLLTHMSGLTYGLQNRTSVDAAYREVEFDFGRERHTSDEYLAHLGKLPLEFAPGSGWNYSVATDVLGIAVERLSGLRLGEYFERHIFAPLGMDDTFASPFYAEAAPRQAVLYDPVAPGTFHRIQEGIDMSGRRGAGRYSSWMIRSLKRDSASSLLRWASSPTAWEMSSIFTAPRCSSSLIVPSISARMYGVPTAALPPSSV